MADRNRIARMEDYAEIFRLPHAKSISRRTAFHGEEKSIDRVRPAFTFKPTAPETPVFL